MDNKQTISEITVLSEENWTEYAPVVNVHLDMIGDMFSDPGNIGRKLGLFTNDKYLVGRRPWTISQVRVKFTKTENGIPGVLLAFDLSPSAKVLVFTRTAPRFICRLAWFLLWTVPKDLVGLIKRRSASK